MQRGEKIDVENHGKAGDVRHKTENKGPTACIGVSGEATRHVRGVSGVCPEVAEVVVAGSVAVSGCVSGKAADGGMDAVAGSYWTWQLAGGCSGVRGQLVSAAWAEGWTEAVSQRWRCPLQLLTCWKLAQGTSNVGRCPCLRPTSLRGKGPKLGLGLV